MMKTLQTWFLKPSSKLTKAEDLRQASLLSLLLLITIVSLTVGILIWEGIPIWFILLLMIAYGISRTVYFNWAVVGSITVLSLSVFWVAMLTDPTPFVIFGAFMWLVVPMLWCSIFLSLRETAVIFSLYIGGIILIPLLNQAITWQLMWQSLGFLLTVGITMLVVMRQRDLIGRDRLAELRANEEQLRLAMSAGEIGTWSWNLVTDWVDWSPETEQIFGLSPGTYDHTFDMYQRLIYPADLAAVQQAVRTALAKPEADYFVQHRVLWSNGEICWVEGRGKVLCNEKGIPTRLTGTATDITLRRRYENEKEHLLIELEVKNQELLLEVSAREQTEKAMRQAEESTRQFQQQLIALQEVNIQLTQSETFDDLCLHAIELGRSRLKFDRLGIWFLDETDTRYMVGSYGTDEQGIVRDERHVRIPTGPAEVFNGEYPTDVKMKSWRRNALFNDKKEKIGDGWNVIAPLWRGDQVIGYISADNLLEKRPFSQDLLELLGLYANTLSHLIVRKQEEIKAQQRREMLEKVGELGKYVAQVADLRECLLRIYKSAKEGLGFDRVGLFLYNDQTRMVTGTFGTDREGNLIEEWDMVLAADIVTPSGKPLYMAERVIFASDYKEVYGLPDEEIAENMVGVGQHVRVVSWVGDLPVAVINADNLVSHRHITEEQVEALQLFAGYAGLAIENARLLAQVQKAEKQYRSIVENAIEGIFQVAPAGYFLSANPAMAQMLGYDSPEELIAAVTDISTQIYTYPEQRLELRRQLETESRVQNFEFEVIRKDGSTACLSQNVHLVNDDEGNLLYFEGTAQDVTARKRAEKEREALIEELEKRNSELERFTYTVSHDLKSPLITIQGFLGFVERDAQAGNIDRLKEDIAYITNATARMRQLLEELLELSRVGRLVNPSEVVGFTELVEEALVLVSGRLRQNNVLVKVAPDMPLVYVDRRRLIEVLQNLLDNAAKFMGDQPFPRIDIGMKMEGEQPVFFMRDNGIGIVPAYQETVFGLFERLDQSIEGTGIGLALVKRIIEVHNGRLWLESAGEGQGTTFYFTLPLADGAPSS